MPFRQAIQKGVAFSSVIFLFSYLALINTSASPLRPHLLEAEAYSETYTILLEIEKGLHLQIQLSISNLGIGDHNGMCRIMFHDGEKYWSAVNIFDNKMWKHKSPGNLEIGPCSIKVQNKQIKILAELEGNRFQVDLHGVLQVTQPPGHTISIKSGDGFLDQQILLRRARADINISMVGDSPYQVHGFGCIYQFWVTALPTDLARRWVRVFGLDKKALFLLFARYPPGEKPAMGFVWFPGYTSPVSLGTIALQKQQNDKIVLSGTNDKITYRLTMQKQLFRQAPVEEAGFWGFLFRPWVGNPVTRTYRASLSSSHSDMPYTAIVEITEDE